MRVKKLTQTFCSIAISLTEMYSKLADRMDFGQPNAITNALAE